MNTEKQIPVIRQEFKDMKNNFAHVYEHLDIIVEHNENVNEWQFFVRTPFAECDDCFFALKTQRGKEKTYRTFEAMMKDMKEVLGHSIYHMETKSEGFLTLKIKNV